MPGRDPGGVVLSRATRAEVVVAALALLVLAAALTAALVPRPDPVPDEVDAVVVLGGGSGERLALGRSLAREHDAALVLSSIPTMLRGQMARLHCGVQVGCFDPRPLSTAGEARGTAALAEQHGWETVVVATSRFHVNRTRMLFGQCLDDVAVRGAPAPGHLGVQVYRRVRELAAIPVGLTVARAC